MGWSFCSSHSQIISHQILLKFFAEQFLFSIVASKYYKICGALFYSVTARHFDNQFVLSLLFVFGFFDKKLILSIGSLFALLFSKKLTEKIDAVFVILSRVFFAKK